MSVLSLELLDAVHLVVIAPALSISILRSRELHNIEGIHYFTRFFEQILQFDKGKIQTDNQNFISAFFDYKVALLRYRPKLSIQDQNNYNHYLSALECLRGNFEFDSIYGAQESIYDFIIVFIGRLKGRICK